MKQDKIPTNQKYYVNMTKVSNIQKGFLKSMAKMQLLRKSLGELEKANLAQASIRNNAI